MNNLPIFHEVQASADPFDADEAVRTCIEYGATSMLIDRKALPPEFFDLSSGVAGALLHRLSVYRMRLACVVPDTTEFSSTFQAFMRESNRGSEYRFFPSRDEAVAWLENSASSA
jgi:hypothetical protein